MAGGALCYQLSYAVVCEVATAVWVTGANQLSCEIVLVAGTPVVRLRLFAGRIVFVIGIGSLCAAVSFFGFAQD